MYTANIKEKMTRHLLSVILAVVSANVASAAINQDAGLEAHGDDAVSAKVNTEIDLLQTQLADDRKQLREELRTVLKQNSNASKAMVKEAVKHFRRENADRINTQNEIAARIRVMQAEFRNLDGNMTESRGLASKEIAFQTVRNIREAATEAKAAAATSHRDAVIEWRDSHDFSTTTASRYDSELGGL